MTPEEIDLNLVQIFIRKAERYAHKAALKYKDRMTKSYHTVSWTEWAEKVKQTAAGLHILGVKRGDRVGILSENCPEWTYADLGILSLGAVNVPFYPTAADQDILDMLRETEIEVIFLAHRGHCDRLMDLCDRQGIGPKTFVLFDGVGDAGGKVMGLKQLWAKGRSVTALDHDYATWVNSVAPDDAATIIYTSGTTGVSKGVVLSHRNFVTNYLAGSEAIKVYPSDCALSFLPLSHVFERMAGYYYMVFNGVEIAYAESMQTVAEDLMTVRPTVAVTVPRLFEKIYMQIIETVERSSPPVRRIFAWAIRVGARMTNLKLCGRPAPLGLRIQHRLAKRLVFRKLRERLGGRVRFFICGGAPLSKPLAEFFFGLDLLILEGYGLTETSPVIAANTPEIFRFGTVGRPLKGVEVSLAPDGEIMTRGPHVMRGYYRNESATREAVRNGWFYTGDLGGFDDEGFLKITGRKKDIIVTSGGKNISPAKIEALILKEKIFSQVVVVGDRRNYLVALIVLKTSELEAFAREADLSHLSRADLLNHPSVGAWVRKRLDRQTEGLARYEKIKYFALLETELSQAGGEITPTLKIRRKVVESKYQILIDGLYSLGEQYRREPGT